jgi:ABC-type transporter Mla subunit MlaD
LPLDRQQLPQDANTLQQMVLDLIAQLDAEQARRIKTERLLQQLLQARSGRQSEQLSADQLALFAAELVSRLVMMGPTVPDYARLFTILYCTRIVNKWQ